MVECYSARRGKDRGCATIGPLPLGGGPAMREPRQRSIPATLAVALFVLAGAPAGAAVQTNTPGAADQAAAYVDDLELVQATGGPPPGGPVTVAVDPSLDRRAINPLIYGVNWAGATQLATGLYTANRRGGNGTTRYNWLFDTSNRAFDYFFLNIHEDGTNGAAADNFVTPTLAAGAEVVMTMPIDQVAKSAARLPGFSV